MSQVELPRQPLIIKAGTPYLLVDQSQELWNSNIANETFDHTTEQQKKYQRTVRKEQDGTNKILGVIVANNVTDVKVSVTITRKDYKLSDATEKL
jgi:hypothetical protein